MYKRICDKCKVVGKGETYQELHAQMTNITIGGKSLDLCPDCLKLLQERDVQETTEKDARLLKFVEGK